jgi:hypothetical protein
MGFYTAFTNPVARREIVRYYQFIKRFDSIYRGNTSHAELALLFPRLQLHEMKSLGRFLESSSTLWRRRERQFAQFGS